MTTITHPANLALTTDIVIDTSGLTIQILTSGAVSNTGATGGVTGQALYSFLKQQWSTSATFVKFPFPMEAITPEQFQFINGWVPKDDTTRSLIRTAGWSELSAGGATVRKYMGVVSLGSLGATDQPYYRWDSGSKVNFSFPGPINQAVQIFGDATSGNFDYTSSHIITLFCREQSKTYASSNNTAIGASSLTFNTQRFPLSNAVDLKISASDATIAATAPWNQISVQYYTSDQSRNVDGTSQPFRIIVTDASGVATTQQIYEKIQYSLRQTTDIDTGAGVLIGVVADALFSFRGDTLVGATSVAIDGLGSNYLNSVELYDQNGVKRLYPFVAAGTINFGAQAGSGDFKYWVFFATNPAGNFGTSTAVIVQDKDGVPLTGTYNGTPVQFSFAYDTNTQGGRTAATTPAVKVLGVGTTGGQYVLVDTTITRAQGQSILLAPAQERNYAV
jgi:hypothetical protein